MSQIAQERERRKDQRRRRKRREVMRDTENIENTEIKVERRVKRETGIGVVIEIGISLNQNLGESRA